MITEYQVIQVSFVRRILTNTCQCMKSDDEKSAESTHQNWHAAFHLSFPRGFTKLGFPEKVENTRHFSTTFSFRLSVAATTAISLTTGEKVLKTHILTFVENGMAEKKKFPSNDMREILPRVSL